MGVQGQREVVWELTVEMQVSHQPSLPGHLSRHCVGWQVEGWLACDISWPYQQNPLTPPCPHNPSSPSASSLLAVEGVSEPEPSGRVGHRLSPGLLQILFWTNCFAKEGLPLHSDFSAPPKVLPLKVVQSVVTAFSAKGDSALVGPHTLELTRGPAHVDACTDDLVVPVLCPDCL